MMNSPDTFSERLSRSAATFLSRWIGAPAQLWDLQPSHRTLRILVRRYGIPGNLLIVCLEPIRIRSPVFWENSDISIAEVTLPDAAGPVFRVADHAAHSEILCGGVELKENVTLE